MSQTNYSISAIEENLMQFFLTIIKNMKLHSSLYQCPRICICCQVSWDEGGRKKSCCQKWKYMEFANTEIALNIATDTPYEGLFQIHKKAI